MPLFKRYLYVLRGENKQMFNSWRSELKSQYCQLGQITSLFDSWFSHWYNRTNIICLVGCEVWVWCKQFVIYQRHLIHCSSFIFSLKIWEAIYRALPLLIRMIPSLSLSNILRSSLFQKKHNHNMLLKKQTQSAILGKKPVNFYPVKMRGRKSLCPALSTSGLDWAVF